MSDEALFRIILVALSALHYFNHHILHRQPPSKKKALDGAVEWLLAITAVAWTLSLALYAIGFSWFDYAAPLPLWLRWVGVAVMAACFPLSSWTYRALGAHFSKRLELRTDHQLVNSGPYRYVRHPMYTTLCLCAVGTCLVTANLFVMAATACVAVVILLRIRNEDAMLAERFGDQYSAYCRRTGGLLPKLL